MICVRNCAIHKISLLFCFMKSQKFSPLYKYLILIHSHKKLHKCLISCIANQFRNKKVYTMEPSSTFANERDERKRWKTFIRFDELELLFFRKKVKCFIVSAIFSLLYTPQRPYYKRNYIRTVPYNAIWHIFCCSVFIHK